MNINFISKPADQYTIQRAPDNENTVQLVKYEVLMNGLKLGATLAMPLIVAAAFKIFISGKD